MLRPGSYGSQGGTFTRPSVSNLVGKDSILPSYLTLHFLQGDVAAAPPQRDGEEEGNEHEAVIQIEQQSLTHYDSIVVEQS